MNSIVSLYLSPLRATAVVVGSPMPSGSSPLVAADAEVTIQPCGDDVVEQNELGCSGFSEPVHV